MSLFQKFPGPYISVKEKKYSKPHNNTRFLWLRSTSRSSLALGRHLRIAFEKEIQEKQESYTLSEPCISHADLQN